MPKAFCAAQTMQAAMLPFFLLIVLALNGARAITVTYNTTELSPDLLAQACLGQMDLNVCDPFSRADRYVTCPGTSGQAPTPNTCPNNQVFDYVKRRCVSSTAADLIPCPKYYCPENTQQTGGPLSPAYGLPFHTPGNFTLMLNQTEEVVVYCPTDHHCLCGQHFKISVTCPATLPRAPMQFVIQRWHEGQQNNTVLAPTPYQDISAFCGDSVQFNWNFPIHVVKVFNIGDPAANSIPVVPYPPQPVYHCPDWEVRFPSTIVQKPEEVVIVPPGLGPRNGVWHPNVTGDFMIVCPVPPQCRLGMVFKLTILPKAANHTSEEIDLLWDITGSNHPDMSIQLGDSIRFSWILPFTFRGVSVLPVALVPKIDYSTIT